MGHEGNPRRKFWMQRKKPPQVPQAPAPPARYTTARGLRIEAAAAYSGLSPFFIEEEIRNGNLPSIGGSGSGVCAAHIVLRERLDEYLERTETCRGTPQAKEGGVMQPRKTGCK